ncbi:hypothetical protein IJD15_00565 [bacterium]|nr:hypothetical protein [bacterium]
MKKFIFTFLIDLFLIFILPGIDKVLAKEITSADSTIEVEEETEDSTFTSFLNNINEFLNRSVFNSKLKTWQLILIIVGSIVIINILIFK